MVLFKFLKLVILIKLDVTCCVYSQILEYYIRLFSIKQVMIVDSWLCNWTSGVLALFKKTFYQPIPTNLSVEYSNEG